MIHIKNILKKTERALSDAHKLIELRRFSSNDSEFQMTICENKKKNRREIQLNKNNREINLIASTKLRCHRA